jgi:hypothetical protein
MKRAITLKVVLMVRSPIIYYYMFRLKILLVAGIGIFFAACSSTKSLSKMGESIPLEMPLSVVELPIRIHKSALERSLNQELGDVLYEDRDMKGDDMELVAEKAGAIQIGVEGQQILYRIPIKLWVKKDLGITNVEANGAIALDFTTDFQIQNDWSLETITELKEYEWLEKPRVKLGFVDLPVKFIASQILNSSKEMIAEAIDEQVRANLDLKSEMTNAWDMLHQPFLVSEEYKTWMLLDPKEVYMAPITIDKDTIESTVVLRSQPKISLGEEPPAADMNPLPGFEWKEVENKGFSILMETEIPFTEAERLAKENMVGQRFESGRRYVIVDDIKLYGRGNRLVVETQLSGSYKGAVNLIGKPKYNAAQKKIVFQKMDVELKTKNVLHKTLGWLFKGTFKRQIQNNLDQYLDENMTTLRETIQQEFNGVPISPGIQMDGNLENLEVANVFVTTDAIKVWVSLKGLLSVEVRGLSADDEAGK